MKRRIELPGYITPYNQIPLGLLMYGLTSILYLATNWYHVFPPVLLPMSSLDLAIPLVPGTIFFYLSEYFLFLFGYVLCRDFTILGRYLYTFSFMQVISCTIFFFWPTTFPRENYPLPADMHWLTGAVFNWLRSTDSPANCCPSLHVSSVYLTALLYARKRKGMFAFFMFWATLVALSTLTTKQHYIIDVVVGIGMALGINRLFSVFFTIRPRAHERRTTQNGNTSPQTS
ncbi:MAG: hypothetical protein A2583_08320 [Bdellovibrionales bacterium RIFOXYD1_FULL_53_11]|nr:MAG: hypothetical protein A2583_08320 [Bdellovibrionales bacterium RIFOXYD1_FULL_53_11]